MRTQINHRMKNIPAWGSGLALGAFSTNAAEAALHYATIWLGNTFGEPWLAGHRQIPFGFGEYDSDLPPPLDQNCEQSEVVMGPRNARRRWLS